jgi:hypothetical protein
MNGINKTAIDNSKILQLSLRLALATAVGVPVTFVGHPRVTSIITPSGSSRFRMLSRGILVQMIITSTKLTEGIERDLTMNVQNLRRNFVRYAEGWLFHLNDL